MASSGGGSSRPPTQATPSGTITGYGSATPWAPSYNSVLSNGMGWADVGEIDAANAANYSGNGAAAAQPAASSGMTEAQMRAMLAQLMGPKPLTPQQQQAMRIGMMPGAQGSYAGGGGGASYTGSSAMRR